MGTGERQSLPNMTAPYFQWRDNYHMCKIAQENTHISPSATSHSSMRPMGSLREVRQ